MFGAHSLRVAGKWVAWNSFKSAFYLSKKKECAEVFGLPRPFRPESQSKNMALAMFPTAQRIFMK